MNTENVDFSKIFEDFITRYPFKGEIHMLFYSKFMNGKPNLEEFHKLKDWQKANESGAVSDILERNKEVVQKLKKQLTDTVKNERARTKLMVPTLNSLEKPISMFNNEI